MIRRMRDGRFQDEAIAGVNETLVEIGWFKNAMLYAPSNPGKNSRVGVVMMHCDQNYMTFNMASQLAKRGFRVLACESIENGPIDDKFSLLNTAVRFMKSVPGVEVLVLMGHSGGATLITAYQSIAENGPQIYQGPEKIYSCRVKEKLEPADAVMLMDANYGNGVMTLFSLDPAVVEEGNGMKLDPEYDIFNPANGYNPQGAHYSEEFKKKYFAAQERRNERLVKMALERLHLIEQGKGFYADDEPFIITAANQPKPNNRLLPQDLHLLNHTKGAYDLIHGDGSITHEVVYCQRTAECDHCMSHTYGMGVNKNTVRGFLSSQAMRTNGFAITADDVLGVDWDSSYASGIGNIKGVHVPLLVMGMTGSYEYLAAEMIYNEAVSENKEIAFVHGATHNFTPNHDAEKTPGEFGDTEGALYDHMAGWMEKNFLS